MSKTEAPVSRLEAVRAALTAAGVEEPQCPKLATTYELTQGGPAYRHFYEQALSLGLTEILSDVWLTDETQIGDGAAFRSGGTDGEGQAVFQIDGTLAFVWLERGELRLTIAGKSRDELAGTLGELRTRYPFAAAPTDDLVPFTFWSLGQLGPQSYTRRITVSPWNADLERNYTADVRDELEDLMIDFEPGKDGQLILWQGPPGTGKTWALRALASEWREWADFHYIVDPDAFFGEHAFYMVEVLLRESFSFDDEGNSSEKWRVLVLEDTGELLASDAKEKTGQALSRLLNVVDGLIGQGLRVLVLVTTNDEIDSFHPAVSRPGRCASQILFSPLTAEEVAAWTGDKDAEAATVAELYARGDKGEDSTLTSDAAPTLGGTVSATATAPNEFDAIPAPAPTDERPDRQPAAEVELPEQQANAAEIKWEAILLVEDRMTEDGRYIAPGATSWRELPLSLMAMLETQEGHTGAFLAGRIDRIWREGNLIMGAGIFNDDEDGRRVAGLVTNKSLTGNSVDLAVREFELAPKSDFDDEGRRVRSEEEEGEETDLFDLLLEGEPLVYVFTDCVIGMSTVCPFPAFADASISVTASALQWRATRQSGMVIVASSPPELPEEEPEVVGAFVRIRPSDFEEVEGLSAAAELVAAVEIPTTPPADWFTDPELDGPTALTFTEDGRVFGHAALWNTCHTGIQGVCTTPPHSLTNYAYFLLGEVETDDGSTVAVGKITLGTGHAAKHLKRAAAAAHYDNTGTATADVAAGEDEYGIWVAGALRPGLTEERLRELRASVLSGDWRSVNGNLELVGMLAVNVPGFPVPRTPRAMITAGADNELEVLSLVAAGVNLERVRSELTDGEQERLAQLADRAENGPAEADPFVKSLIEAMTAKVILAEAA